MPHSGRFQRADRVVSARDYKRHRRRGKRLTSKFFAVSVVPLKLQACEPRYREHLSLSGGRRLGITVSRKVGNAVVRNRVKRSIREWFRQSRQDLECDVDIVVVARPRAAALKPLEIFEELLSLFGLPRGGFAAATPGETM